MSSEQLEQKLTYLTQFYFEDDKPYPWMNDLTVYPVLVKDYYPFHSCVEVITTDKNKDVSGVGISMSHLSYLIYRMKDEKIGRVITNQFINMMEMIFHIKNGLYCNNPDCCNYNSVDKYGEVLEDGVENEEAERRIKPHEDVDTFFYDDMWKKASKIKGEDERVDFLKSARFCPKCGKPMREVLTIAQKNDKDVLCVYDNIINSKAYDELRQIICRWNMLDWDDSYIDPELEADLALKAKLENKDMVTPTLEKQKAVLCVRTAYKVDELDNLSLRKLAMLIRTSDAVLHYQIYRSASMSGLVTFKSEIKHYLYSSDKKSVMDDLINADQFKDKMQNAMKA